MPIQPFKPTQSAVLLVMSSATANLTLTASSTGAWMTEAVKSTIKHALTWEPLRRVIWSREQNLSNRGEHAWVQFANSRNRELSSTPESFSTQITCNAVSPQVGCWFIQECMDLLMETRNSRPVLWERLGSSTSSSFLRRSMRWTDCQDQSARGRHYCEVSSVPRNMFRPMRSSPPQKACDQSFRTSDILTFDHTWYVS